MNADKIASNENTALDEKSQIAETIRAIDDFYRQADELYRQTAWRMGLPDCAFDIVYALVNEDGLTQKQLCELGFSSKQTAHSSIKRMVDKGVVELRGDTPRTQRVYLTGYGRKQYEAHIKAVLAAEHEAVAIFTDEEQRQLTSAMKRYINALNENLPLETPAFLARSALFSPKGFPMSVDMSKHFSTSALIRFTLPTIAMMIFTSCYTIVDGFFVSNYAGKTALAAVNLIFPAVMILASVGMMIGTGGSALVAKTLGEGDRPRARRHFSLLIIFAFVVG